MRLAIIGYGKMGKAVEKIARERRHNICCIIDDENDLKNLLTSRAEVVVEFTNPESAYKNIRFCIENNFRVVSGTTGWLDKYDTITELVGFKNSGFFYASNFSIGVNIFREVNKHLAQLMNRYAEYDVRMEEVHHTEKKDAPSGTAITLAEDIIDGPEDGLGK